MNVSKFSLAECFSNDTGKTSGSALCGVFICFVGAITFAFGCFIKNTEIITNSVIVIGSGSALLGIRKIINNKETDNSVTAE